ncbi:MAG: carboxypeptidase regulatory-like domain-containing protein [Gemmatimonadota bacterium]|nr:MAG: carboxypeptidase regulatory-like domain-containing protein [Gemmatimonadota bacterium]
MQAQTIRGRVLDDSTSSPIAGAEVIMSDSANQNSWIQVTDENGQFELRVPPGYYTFEVLRMGYRPIYTEGFEVAEGAGNIDLTITLPNEPIFLLDPVVVEGEEEEFAPGPLAGFRERKRRGYGIQLDREQIEEKAPVHFTDILRNIPGIRLIPAGGDEYEVHSTRGCPVSFYFDGVRYYPGAAGLNTEVGVSSVEAVEVYRRASETPAEFLSGGSRCGVVVIWSRRG